MSTPKGGRLGLGVTAAGVPLKLYETPSDLGMATVSLHLINNTSASIHYTVYISTSDAPTDADRVDENSTLPGMSSVSLRCRVMGPGEKLFVKTTGASGLVCRAEGEEANASTVGGNLGKASVANAGTYTTVAKIPGNVAMGVASIYLFNPTNVAIEATVYVAQGDTPSVGEVIVPTDTIAPGGHLEITCRQLSPGESVVVRANNAGGLLARVEGFTVTSAG